MFNVLIDAIPNKNEENQSSYKLVLYTVCIVAINPCPAQEIIYFFPCIMISSLKLVNFWFKAFIDIAISTLFPHKVKGKHCFLRATIFKYGHEDRGTHCGIWET